MRDAQDRWFGTCETPEVIVYNRDVVHAEEAPKDWDDVLDPKWRDKILIRNPNPSDSMRAIFGAMIWRYLLMQKIARQAGLISLWDLPDVRLYQEQKKLPVAYNFPASGTPAVSICIAIVHGAPHEEEAKCFYEFVTTPDSLIHAARDYYRIPVSSDIDRQKLPDWMNQPFTRMPFDWNLLRSQGTEWLHYWDTQIRGRGK